MKMIVQFSPTFLANLVFKIGSIAIISTFFKGYVIIYICLGIIKCTIVAFYHFNNTRKNERPGHASCSGQGRKCRLDKEDKKQILKAVDKEDKKGKVVDKVTKKSFLYFGPILFYSK